MDNRYVVCGEYSKQYSGEDITENKHVHIQLYEMKVNIWSDQAA